MTPDRDRAADVLLGVCVGLLLAGAVCAALLLGSPAHGAVAHDDTTESYLLNRVLEAYELKPGKGTIYGPWKVWTVMSGSDTAFMLIECAPDPREQGATWQERWAP